MTPATWKQRTQFPRPGCECARVIPAWFRQHKVKLSARNAICSTWIGQCGPKQATNGLFRHETKHAAAGKVELSHSGQMMPRQDSQYFRIESDTALLVCDVEDKMRSRMHGVVRLASKVRGGAPLDCAPPLYVPSTDGYALPLLTLWAPGALTLAKRSRLYFLQAS